MSRRIEAAAEWAIHVAVALLLMWPVTLHLSRTFIGWRDANYYMWLAWRTGELIGSGDIFSLRIPDVVYPYGVDFLLLDGHLPALIGGLWNLVAGPFLAYNLAMATATLLNIWAGRRLGKLFSDSRIVWALCGLGFALAPAIALRMPVHFTMYFAFPSALLLDNAVHVVRGDRPLRPVAVGALLFVAYLCSIYQLVFGGLAYILVVLIGLGWGRALARSLGRLALAGAVGVLLMLPFLIPRLDYERSERAAGGEPVLLRDSFRASADGLSLFAQPAYATFDLPGSARLRDNFRDANVHESTIFPGWLLLAGVAGVMLLRSPLRRALVTAFFTLWLLTMGTSLKLDGDFLFTTQQGAPVPWLPYTSLLEFPGLGSLRAANRAGYALAAVCALALALVLGALWSRCPRVWQRALLVGGCVTLLLTSLIVPLPESTLNVAPPARAALDEIAERAGPGDSVLQIPADCDGETLRTVTLQIVHRAPMIGCQASPSAIPFYSSLDRYTNSQALARARCVPGRIGRHAGLPFTSNGLERGDVEALHEELGVRFIIVNKVTLEARRTCAKLVASIPLLNRYEKLGEDESWIIYDTQST